jgi:hypothetical protein
MSMKVAVIIGVSIVLLVLAVVFLNFIIGAPLEQTIYKSEKSCRSERRKSEAELRKMLQRKPQLFTP